MSRRYFGTDGIRGRVGEAPMTPEFVLKLGWALGRALTGGRRDTVLIGKDTRISGYLLESALEAGLSAAGANIKLLGPMPTPGIAYLTRTLRAAAGIVISASHNPFYDNGVKIFSSAGAKLPDAVEAEIEALLEQPLETVESAALGKAERLVDAAGRYIEFCKSTVPWGTNLRGLKIVVDCAHGATYHVAPNVFEELGAKVVRIGNRPDGLNINEACGATNTTLLQAAVVAENANLGIALDGDGDRVIMVDEHGEAVDGDELLYILSMGRYARGGDFGGVVGTLMSNLGLELALGKCGIPFERAAVGDRYVLERMAQHGWLLGGESSGHIICLDKTSTGDGIVSALQVLLELINTQKSLSEAKAGMCKLPQLLINVPVINGDGKRLLSAPAVRKAVQEAEARLAGEGRVLLRPSGTEPIVRVMVEGRDAAIVCSCAEMIAASISGEPATAGTSEMLA